MQKEMQRNMQNMKTPKQHWKMLESFELHAQNIKISVFCAGLLLLTKTETI